MKYNFKEDAFFQFYLSDKQDDMYEKCVPFKNGELKINLTQKTDCELAKQGYEEIAVIGLCIDSMGEIERKDFPDFLLKNGEHNINIIINLTNRCAGKFVILYFDGKKVYAFGDAVNAMQINYVQGKQEISTNEYLLAKSNNLEVDEYLLHIRQSSANISQPMPTNLTLYKDIKCLMVNHYLTVDESKETRFFPDEKFEIQENLTSADELDKQIKMITNIAREYDAYISNIVALTSGWDSRVVFNFYNNINPQIESFTYNHKYFTDETGDKYIPIQICKKLDKKHILIEEDAVSPDYLEDFKKIAGENFSYETLASAQSAKSRFGSKAITDGNIIGHIANGWFCSSIPSMFFTKQYMASKLHNYSKYISKELAQYYCDIKNSYPKFTYFDIFGLESRCGRWGSQAEQINSLVGVPILNLFNCRSIIYNWMQTPKKFRTAMNIHKYYLAKIGDKKIANIPINPGSRKTEIVANWPIYLFATRLKFVVGKIKYLIKHG